MATSLTALTGQSNVSQSFTLGKSTNLPGSSSALVTPGSSWTAISWTFGVGANQMNEFYAAVLSFSAAPQVLDLTNLVDPFGQAAAVNLAKVKMLIIYIKSTLDVNTLLMGAAASNEWTGLLSAGSVATIMPGAPFFVCAPTVTGLPVSGSSKSLQLDPGSQTFDAEVFIGGIAA